MTIRGHEYGRGTVVTLTTLLLVLNISVGRPSEGKPLTDSITHFEPLSYDIQPLQQQHHIAKRSTDRLVKLDFNAHARNFKVRLRRDTSIFTSDFVVETSKGLLNYDTSRAYIGHLEGDGNSTVHGIISKEGLFEGRVYTPDEQYVIQRAQHFFPEPQNFHSVIYKHSDVKHDYGPNTCMSDMLNKKLKQELSGLKKPNQAEILKRDVHSASDLYSEKRNKRALEPTKTTCELYMQADHLYFEHISSNEEMVVEQLTQHVQGVKAIYKLIDFDGNGNSDNIDFIIKRMKIHTDKTKPGYQYDDNYGVEKFLELFSEQNFDAYCLAYMFTYRDFDGGTLGLAWTGSTSNAGGVCEKNAVYRGSARSLNTGIVTTINYGKDVAPSVSTITLSHEIGHNMGSEHDPEDDTSCTPGGDSGNYIMYARATTGDKSNNNKFSSCSINYMHPVMTAKARSTDGCFVAPKNNICGNEVVEDGEECDCGWDNECEDRCCNPMTETPAIQTPCTLKKNITGNADAVCSPSQGTCCNGSSCQIVTAAANQSCRAESQCAHSAVCAGGSAACPSASHKANSIPCGDNQLCYNGECTSNICPVYNMLSCQCEPDVAGDLKDEKLCQVCCKEPGDGKPCKSSFASNLLPNRSAVPGDPCLNDRGYCDAFLRCREVDPSGPLSSLKNLFSAEGIENMKQWLTQYWYIVVASAVGFFVLLGIFVKVCGVKKVPEKDKQRKGDPKDPNSKNKNGKQRPQPRRKPTSASAMKHKSNKVGDAWV